MRTFLLTLCSVVGHCHGVFFIPTYIVPDCQEIKVTVYWGVESQTDNTPDVTAYGLKFDPYNPPRICAVSRDLEEIYRPGDTIYLKNIGNLSGAWVVGDRMNKRWTNRIDLLTKPSVMGRWKVEKYEILR